MDEERVATPLQLGAENFANWELNDPGSMLNTVKRNIGNLGPAGTALALAGGVLSFSHGSGALKSLATALGLGMAFAVAQNNGMLNAAKDGIGKFIETGKWALTPQKVSDIASDVETSLASSMQATTDSAQTDTNGVNSVETESETPAISEEMYYA